MGAGWNAWAMRYHKTHTSPERERWDAAYDGIPHIQARSVSDGIIPGRRGMIAQAVFSAASTPSAAAIVASISSSVCMLEKKSASYWLHGR